MPDPPFAGFGNAFSTGTLATTFPKHVIGIREAVLPEWGVEGSDYGLRLEGVKGGVGFSVNGLYYRQQLPSLHGGSAGPPAINPFLAETGTFTSAAGLLPPGGIPANVLQDPATGAVLDFFGNAVPRPYLIAFDIHFPRVFLIGGSADLYSEAVKSSFRLEVAYTDGEEFPNTLVPELFSESDVIRWVVGWDRPTFIKFLNPRRAFLISAQVFGQHLLDHELLATPGGPAGMPDWENNLLATLLFQGMYKNDLIQPRILTAYDGKAHAGVISPGVDWLISDDWRLIFAANVKFGRAKNNFDDCRACNQFPPFTDPAGGSPVSLPVGQSLNRLVGYAPLGAFRAGPIGMALDEDELQVLLRYRF